MIAFLVDMRRLRAHYEKYDPTIAAFKYVYFGQLVSHRLGRSTKQ